MQWSGDQPVCNEQYSKLTVHGHVVIYLLLMIDSCPMLDEELHYIFTAVFTSNYERRCSVLSKLMYDDKNNYIVPSLNRADKCN